jgi:hypothetical protein
MTQFVPQLILGNALDGSSGAPDWKPHWGEHATWSFAAHYFFEVLDEQGKTVGHAAYGKMFPTRAGEKLFTSFDASAGAGGAPEWTLRMGVIGDDTRVSELHVAQPYMGLGAHWPTPTNSWAETNYSNLCINMCWELYGAVDRAHLPSSGATYELNVTRGAKQSYPWVSQWDEDEGFNKSCASSKATESHSDTAQRVRWDIDVPAASS